ncbi:unnamed protein product [Strongylus vulgaris]|uniref:Beta-N-acetylhexosaminidase n=1 Tax=Strongylus vulgaris TaxID=40348 RepID=A0A3P7II80_STRVU|nr:unnamed protein product [Strongylus vulgaris]
MNVQALHPNSKRIHIGGDEAAHIAEDERCKARLASMGEPDRKRAVEKLKLAHIAITARLTRLLGYREVFAWNDMFDKSMVEDLRDSGLGELITPVVWGYRVDVTAEDYFPNGLFDRISQVFPKIFFASAFKGAQSQGENFIDLERYLETHQSYVKLYRMHSKVGNWLVTTFKLYQLNKLLLLLSLEGRVGGIILTGWQRYMHHAPLCELLAISIPSLITDLVYLEDVERTTDMLWKKIHVGLKAVFFKEVNALIDVQRLLKCPVHMNTTSSPVVIDTFTYIPHKDAYLKVCDFKGKELFKLVMEDLHMLNWKVSRLRYITDRKNELMAEIPELAKKVLISYSFFVFRLMDVVLSRKLSRNSFSAIFCRSKSLLGDIFLRN